jgi:hypothetical protein
MKDLENLQFHSEYERPVDDIVIRKKIKSCKANVTNTKTRLYSRGYVSEGCIEDHHYVKI